MSTRGAFGYILGGTEKVAYNHCDSDPQELGMRMLEYLAAYSIEEIRRVAEGIVLVGEDGRPTPDQASECEGAGTVNTSVGRRSKRDWYCLLREAQGDLGIYHRSKLKYMLDFREFLHDSLSCEWAYIINLDSGMFEVYRGFNGNPLAAGRYAKYTVDSKKRYYGVALAGEYPIDGLKTRNPGDVARELECAQSN